MIALVPFRMLDDAPWVWQYSWNKDMPAFFQDMPGRGAEGVYANVLDYLDTTPVTYHYTEPVDPTEYQNEWLGDVINIY
eukprot:CAMPEP_0202822160 /NCGR_PEP_ID=MMETSP1389-20130828/10875_1 /ASSEMBLY_ACC=CAM_ASM_000865 /TAXON_ID=302021 /ORGANISM="Rhodomonas sp., Strain CCMP768" /LENGTH=78 /DNA_ID=CAMNT_0049495033 /DNA_START=74 /DNA_END=310 /DNA_ORIENTATION=+